MSAADRQYQQHEDARAAREAAQRRKAAKAGRDQYNFVPWLPVVQESPGWRHASHTARSLLMDMLHSAPNGALSASAKYLRPLGWRSDDVVRRAVRDLLACGLLFETRKGHRPNVAALYACTWLKLSEKAEGMDPAKVRTFRRGAYLTPEASPAEPQKRRTAAATASRQMQAICKRDGYTLTPSDGAFQRPIAPSDGVMPPPIAPSDGAVRAEKPCATAPSDGRYLEIAIYTDRRKEGREAQTPLAASRLGRLLSSRGRLMTHRPDAYRTARQIQGIA